VRLTLRNSKARTLHVRVLRNGRFYAASTLRLRRNDGRAQTVRWRPSGALMKRLRTGVSYGFQVTIAGQAATRAFRLRNPR